jgi:hypothetical protein
MDLCRPLLLGILRTGALLLGLSMALAPLGLSCCTGIPCSAHQPESNSQPPCHGATRAPCNPRFTPVSSACQAGEFTLEAFSFPGESLTDQGVRAHASAQTPFSHSVALFPNASFFHFPVRSWALSPHFANESLPDSPLRI